MESMLYQGHRFLGGIKHFWMAVRVWKTNIVLEDLARQKRTKMWPKWGISWGLIDVWQSEWSVVCWIWIAKPSMKFWPSNWACRKFADTWMLHHDNAPCHTAISVNEFLAKKGISVVPQPPYSPDLSPCDFFLFPKTQIPPQRSSSWNCGQHPKGRERPVEGTSTWRLPALLPGVAATSPAVCGFRSELLWRGYGWFIGKRLKKYIAPVSLLSWRTVYVQGCW